MITTTDIDIDVANRDELLALFKSTPAMIASNNHHKKHNTGVYFHDVPSNPFNGICTVDHKKAEEHGFFKLDILNVGIYKDISTPAQLDTLLEAEPMWELLEHEDVVTQLFHLHNHYAIVSRMKPTSIEQLAAVLAIIRPAKRHLLGKPWDVVLQNVWVKPTDDSYYFKKAHAISYALAIVVQLNTIVSSFSQD